jgi:hypothetical protein
MAYPMTSKISKPSDPMAVGSAGPVSGKKRGSWLKGLITLIVVLIIVGGGIYLIVNYTGLGSSWFSTTTLHGNWQAVFLTNGQVYFGKIIKVDQNYVVLRDIYYLQIITKPLQRSQEGDAAAVQQQQQQEQRLTLIKLGNEIHGPKDEMLINRDQVVIMEDLKDDSRVVQAITDYLNQNSKK